MNWINFVWWAISVQCCSALKCYFCGTESAHETDQPNTDPRDIYAHSGSCHDFETKIVYPIRQYVVNCGDDDHYNGYHYSNDPSSDETDSKPLCVKFVSRSVHTDKFYTQRGCTSATTRTGKSHRLGCGPTMMNRDDYMSNGIEGGGGGVDGASASSWPGHFNISNVEHICFCDTDYCNQSPVLNLSLALIWVHLLIQMCIVSVICT